MITAQVIRRGVRYPLACAGQIGFGERLSVWSHGGFGGWTDWGGGGIVYLTTQVLLFLSSFTGSVRNELLDSKCLGMVIRIAP